MAPIMKTLLLFTVALGAVANPILGDSDNARRSDLTCANVRCRSGYQCKMVQGKPKCLPTPPQEPELTCATVKCKAGLHCEIQDGKPRCLEQLQAELTCATVKCKAGLHCEIQDGKPRCVDEPQGACGPKQCAPGLVCCNPLCGTCVMPGDSCTMGSCPPITYDGAKRQDTPAAAKPAPKENYPVPAAPAAAGSAAAGGGKCGSKATCGQGQFCCNSSCGICAPIGGACTQQFCTQPQAA